MHELRFRNMKLAALVLPLALAACSGGGAPGPVPEPLAVVPPPGFASDTVLVVSSEETAGSLAMLSVETATGELGYLPGSPADVGVRIGDVETLAADPARRRVFFGSNVSGRIAVVELDAAGAPVPVAGSPFAAERTQVSRIEVAPSGGAIYVGYHGEQLLSRYDVDAAGALTLAQSVSTAPSGFVETMLRVGDVLYVGFRDSSDVVGYRLDGDAFATDGAGAPVVVADVAVNPRPDHLIELGGRLYCSLSADGSIDAFTIEADGSLTRLPGAPYDYPGLGAFELMAASPGGDRIAVGAETPSATVALFAIAPDGSLAPTGSPLVVHGRKGGPEGIVYSADGRFLFLCDHVGQGLYVLEVVGDEVSFAPTPRYDLPGRQIHVLRLELAVSP
jgi:6-phosphogluconolactonase (cycloisomerase 2 family)